MPPPNADDFDFPKISSKRGVGFWLRPSNLWAARRDRFRRDRSNEWRGLNEQRAIAASMMSDVRQKRSVPYSKVVGLPKRANQLRIALLADTGDGDKSQYGLLPMIRHVDADLLIINGDIAYPAGRLKDYVAGFFEPYRGLDVPIWAVPGNHEYYSKNRGQEFFDVFCSPTHSGLWREHGLKLVQQPGSYWELSEPARTQIVIIGIDTGKSGNLDGARNHLPADAQHNWLEWRLEQADSLGQKAIVLFHIPALVNERRHPDVRLDRLHAILARHDCVKLVTCGHVHNLQKYSAAVFRRFLGLDTQPPRPWPEYIICGGGGAYLSQTNFRRGTHPVEYTYPDVDEWLSYANLGWRLVENRWYGPTVVGRLGAAIKERFTLDSDVSDYLSFLVIDIDFREAAAGPPGADATVTPIFHRGLGALFNVPPGTRIDVRNGIPPVDVVAADAMFQRAKAIRI